MTGMRGGEYVFEAIAEIFPRAELFTLIYSAGKLSPVITSLKRHVSFLQKVPRIEERYRHFLPVMPKVIEQFDLSGFDLVISTSHCVAKGARKRPDAVHVSYVFAPMRYMWDRFDEYFGPGRSAPHVRLAARALRKPLQSWDRSVSQPDRVDRIVTQSRYIQAQIREAYGRESDIVYPFADLSRFTLPRKPSGSYLMVGAFAPYKRVDLAIEAFNRMKLPLLIVGGGQDASHLKKIAGPTVEFLGELSNEAIADLYSKCRAFVFPGQEDFGITPLEANASGAPVIAYGAGGVLDTLSDETGILFKPQTLDALVGAVQKLERGEVTFDEAKCRAQPARFTRASFQRGLVSVVRDAWAAKGKPLEPLDLLIRGGWAKNVLPE
jgi:glycosyltransferase involved in cell wall biosynthesis